LIALANQASYTTTMTSQHFAVEVEFD